MKRSRSSVRSKATAVPELRFEDHRLTSFAGLVVIQKFFQVILFKSRLQQGQVRELQSLLRQTAATVPGSFAEFTDSAP